MAFSFLHISCSSSNDGGDSPNPTPNPTPPVVKNEVDFWLTKGNQTVLLQKQTGILAFGNGFNIYPSIEVSESDTFQTVDGFGFTLTGGSAQVINKMTASKKQELLQELFGSGANSIGLSYLRMSIGASDLNATPFTYDDMPTGQTDVNLTNFSLAPDMADVIPLLKEILAINPNTK